jgi:hypothetical protein
VLLEVAIWRNQLPRVVSLAALSESQACHMPALHASRQAQRMLAHSKANVSTGRPRARRDALVCCDASLSPLCDHASGTHPPVHTIAHMLHPWPHALLPIVALLQVAALQRRFRAARLCEAEEAAATATATAAAGATTSSSLDPARRFLRGAKEAFSPPPPPAPLGESAMYRC